MYDPSLGTATTVSSSSPPSQFWKRRVWVLDYDVSTGSEEPNTGCCSQERPGRRGSLGARVRGPCGARSQSVVSTKSSQPRHVLHLWDHEVHVGY